MITMETISNMMMRILMMAIYKMKLLIVVCFCSFAGSWLPANEVRADTGVTFAVDDVELAERGLRVLDGAAYMKQRELLKSVGHSYLTVFFPKTRKQLI